MVVNGVVKAEWAVKVEVAGGIGEVWFVLASGAGRYCRYYCRSSGPITNLLQSNPHS